MNNTQRQQEIESQKLINLALVLILILSVFALVSIYISRGVRIYNTNHKVAEAPSVFVGVQVEAKSALVYDIQTKKILFEKNADVPLALASVTKIMTAVTALDLLPKNTVVTIRKEFLKEEGDSGLRTDEKWKIRDLLDFSLVSSSNDGAAAIAAAAGAVGQPAQTLSADKEVFIKKMNEKAKSIGMEHATFYNVTGLDLPEGNNGGYASSKDIAKLFEYALRNHPEIFDATRLPSVTTQSTDNVNHRAVNTNLDINNIPNIIGSKTGFTDIAGGNLGIIFDAGLDRPVVVVVLGSSAEGRFTDVKTLVAKALEQIGKETNQNN